MTLPHSPDVIVAWVLERTANWYTKAGKSTPISFGDEVALVQLLIDIRKEFSVEIPVELLQTIDSTTLLSEWIEIISVHTKGLQQE